MGRKTQKQHDAWRKAETGERPSVKGSPRVCAVYPGPYHVAMANLGYQWLIHALGEAGLSVDRVVWPEAELIGEAQAETLTGVDSDRPAAQAAVWFVSLSFENDLVRLAGLLRLAGLPQPAEERSAHHPLIVVGGVAAMLNPEPAAAFADVCLLGEGQAALGPFLAYMRENDPTDRDRFLPGLAGVPGAYVGRFYQPQYAPDGAFLGVQAQRGFPTRVKIPKEKIVDPLQTRTHLRAPEAAFGDALLLETGRGCTQRCRFCAAGHLFLPYRPAKPPQAPLPDLGQRTLGLVGANVSAHPQLDAWLALAEHERVTLSSLRLGSLSETQWQTLKRGKLASVAVAPEAGSERLRRVVNKPVTDEEILAEVSRAVAAGIRNIKMYFLVGLPTEKPDDLTALVELVQRAREAAMEQWKAHGRAGKLTISVNPFIPKPHTPFQWHEFGDPKDLKKRLDVIRQGLRRVPNVEVQTESINEAVLQALLSVGDRRAAELARLVDREGNIPAGLRAWGQNTHPILMRPRSFDETLPWDHIETGVTRRYLMEQYEDALDAKTSPPCFTQRGCRLCGVC